MIGSVLGQVLGQGAIKGIGAIVKSFKSPVEHETLKEFQTGKPILKDPLSKNAKLAIFSEENKRKVTDIYGDEYEFYLATIHKYNIR